MLNQEIHGLYYVLPDIAWHKKKNDWFQDYKPYTKKTKNGKQTSKYSTLAGNFFKSIFSDTIPASSN